MNTNNAYANITNLGGPRICERLPQIENTHSEPVSTELVSERLGTDLIAFCERVVWGTATASMAVELRRRISLAGIREREGRS